MMNVSILIGRLTKDPVVRYTKQESIPVASFSIAVDRNYTRSDKKITDFIDIEAWRATAQFVEKYFKKGMLVSIVGSLQQDSWEKNGEKRYSYKIIATECRFAEARKKEDETENQSAGAEFDPYANSEDTGFDPFAA